MNDYIIIILNVLGQADPQKYAQDIVKVFSESMGSEVKIIVITTTTQPTSVQVCPNKFIVTTENLASMQIMCETMKANVLQAINSASKMGTQIVTSSNVSFEGNIDSGYSLGMDTGDLGSSIPGDTNNIGWKESNCRSIADAVRAGERAYSGSIEGVQIPWGQVLQLNDICNRRSIDYEGEATVRDQDGNRVTYYITNR